MNSLQKEEVILIIIFFFLLSYLVLIIGIYFIYFIFCFKQKELKIDIDEKELKIDEKELKIDVPPSYSEMFLCEKELPRFAEVKIL